MKEREDSKPLSGFIQLDDAYWGGERHGGKRGRGLEAKTPFVATVQTSEDGFPITMRFTSLKVFSQSGDRPVGTATLGGGQPRSLRWPERL
jgi:hypothetical protein